MNLQEKVVTIRGRRFLLRVETSHEALDYQKYEDLRDEIWGFPEDHLAGTRNLICENFLHEGGSLFIGAFDEDAARAFPPGPGRLVGFCYGFAGMADKSVGFRNPENLRFYSQYTGVREAFRSFGLGIFLKEFQREIVRDVLGLRSIICTYDPLTGVNALRNVHHFGMEVLEYRVATYGECGGLLNRPDVPTDRFLMSWDLNEAHARRFSDGEPDLPGSVQAIGVLDRRVSGRTTALELEVVSGVRADAGADVVLVRIPADFYRMLRETDVQDPEVRRIPLDWRMATRKVFTGLLEGGFQVTDFRRAGGRPAHSYYVLKKIRPAPR